MQQNTARRRGSPDTLGKPPAADSPEWCYNHAEEAIRVAIMRVLRAIVKELSAIHRWFMKYSGMTMIIDNVEERRRWRQNEAPPHEDSRSQFERDSPSQKQETQTLTRTAAEDDPAAGSTAGLLGSTEKNKKVLG